MNAMAKTSALLLILLLLSGFHQCFRLVKPLEVVKANGAVSGSWLVYYEQRDESAYRFNFNGEASGLEMWLYIQTSSEDQRGYNDDWIRITVVGKPFEVATSEGHYIVEPIVGLTRIGYKTTVKKASADYMLPTMFYRKRTTLTMLTLRCMRPSVSRGWISPNPTLRLGSQTLTLCSLSHGIWAGMPSTSQKTGGGVQPSPLSGFQ